MLRPSRVLVSCFLLAILGGSGCEKEAAVTSDGTQECEDMGSVCHEAGEALGGEYQECHDIGHVGDGPVCLRNYRRCIALCEDAHLGEGGAGGEHGDAGAGGESH